MHILMISDVYFPRVNGVSTSIKTFRDELRTQGHRVTLLAPEYPAGGEDNSDIIRIPSYKVLLDPEDRMMSARKIKSLLYMLGLMSVDIIHIHTPFVAHYTGVWLAKQLGVPCVESYHTFFEEYLYHYVPFMPRKWMKSLARKYSVSQCNSVDSLVVPSSAMLNVLRDYGVRSDADIIPTGVHTEQFSIGDGDIFRDKNHIDRDRPVMLYVGRVAHEKNINFLLDVVCHVRQSIENILMIIAGEGPAIASLKERVHELGIEENVLFKGYMSRGYDLPDCYASANVFVFASRTETQGLVILEAMAAGTPVVSLAVMGTADVLVEGEGALISPEDASIFAKKAVRVLKNPQTREWLSKSAEEYARKWSVSQTTATLLNLYSRLNKKENAKHASAEIIQDADA